MRKHYRVDFLVASLLLMWWNTQAFGHDPEGEIFLVWQWPTSHLPVLDGDISEWEAVPDEFWIDIHQTHDLFSRC